MLYLQGCASIMLRLPTPIIAGIVLCSVLLVEAHPALAQTGAQRAADLLDVVSTARGLGNTPIKDGGGNPPPADDDGDGVANDADLCPDTPIGETVDAEGCSASQRDPEAVVRQVYEDDVNPLIVSAQGGCTSSGCHGRAGAPGGLRLYGAGEDNSTQRNYDSFTSYIGRESAARLLSKLSGGLGHGGGTRYVAGEADYNTIAAWAESVEALLP